MSTRATYKVNGVICYNQYDNYPTGAARHLCNVIEKSNSLDLFAMVRGMDQLVMAKNIFDGPTEYYYEINAETGFITCYSIPFDKEQLIYHSSGFAETWINNQIDEYEKKVFRMHPNESPWGNNETKEDYTIIRMCDGRDGYPAQFKTVAQIRKEAAARFERGKYQLLKGFTGSGKSSLNESFKLLKKINALDEAIKEEYFKITGERYVE